METILLKYHSVGFLFQCIMGVIGVVTFIVLLIWLLREIYLAWREKKAKVDEQTKDDKKVSNYFLCDHLTPMEWCKTLLTNIENGRLYQITSPGDSDTFIACVISYFADIEILCCYAYLRRSMSGKCEMHIGDPCGLFKSRSPIKIETSSIEFNDNLYFHVRKGMNISPFVLPEDYKRFQLMLQKAGCKWNIEKGKEDRFGSHTYQLKEIKIQ